MYLFLCVGERVCGLVWLVGRLVGLGGLGCVKQRWLHPESNGELIDVGDRNALIEGFEMHGVL